MIKPTSELGYETDPIPTPDTWMDYVDEQFGTFGPDSYVAGTYNMLEKLEPIIAITDFKEMKAKLTELYQERYDFVAHTLKVDY